MEIRNLETFISVVEFGSFSKAADVLGYTQSTITVHIKQLEDELGVLLFDRIGKKVLLTSEGHKLFNSADMIIGEVSKIKEEITRGNEPGGLLRIGTIPSISVSLFPELIHKIHKKFPKIDIRLTVKEIDTILDMLSHNRLDIAYGLKNNLPDLVSMYEKIEEVHFVAPPTHPLADKENLRIKDLEHEEFVLPAPNIITREYVNDLAFIIKEQNLKIKAFLVTGGPALMIPVAIRENAITFLPDYATESHIKQGKLKKIPVKDVNITIVRSVLYHKDKWISPQMEAFFSIVKE